MLTDFLKLFKPDMPADGTKTFNVKTMLSDNWDKIEAFASAINQKMISTDLFTAANDFIIGTGNGTVVKRTLAETKEILGLSTLNKLPTTTGSSTAFVVALPGFKLEAGQKFSAKFHTAGTGSPTAAVEGTEAKPLKKSDGTTSFFPKAGGAYTFIFDGVNFQLQGEGGEYGTGTQTELLSGFTLGTENGVVPGTLALSGDAVPSQVLAPRTFYNTNAKSKQIGTMVDRGAVNITPSTVSQAIAQGYHSGGGVVQGDADLAGANILYGKNIFGHEGQVNKPVVAGDVVWISMPKDESCPAGYETYTMKKVQIMTAGTVRLKMEHYFAINTSANVFSVKVDGVTKYTSPDRYDSVSRWFSEVCDVTISAGSIIEFCIYSHWHVSVQVRNATVSLNATAPNQLFTILDT